MQIATVERLIPPEFAAFTNPRESVCMHKRARVAGRRSAGKLLGIAKLIYLMPLVLLFPGDEIGGDAGLSGGVWYLPAVGLAVGIVLSLICDQEMRRQSGRLFAAVRFF